MFCLGLVLLAGLAAVFSYPLFLAGFADRLDVLQVEVFGSGDTTARLYQENPRQGADAFGVINSNFLIKSSTEVGGATTSTYEIRMPQNKLRGGKLWFLSSKGIACSLKRVSMNGELGQISDGGVVEFANKRMGNSGRATLCAGLLFIMISLMALGAVWLVIDREERISLQYLYAFVLALGISLFWTAVFFPALMSEDSVSQWQQGLSGVYMNYPAPTMAMVMGLVQKVYPHPAFFTLVQGCVFWFSVFFLLRVLITDRHVWLVSCLLFAINPALWTYSAVHWKSVWAAALMLLACGFFIRSIRMRRIKDFVLGSLAVSFAICFRENAITLLPVPVIVALCWIWPAVSMLRRMLIAIAISVLLVLPSVILPTLPQNMEDKAPKVQSMLPVPVIIGIMKQMDPAADDTKNEVEAFDRTLGAGRLKALVDAYDPASGNCLIYFYYPQAGAEEPLLSADICYEHRRFLRRKAFTLAWKNPAKFMIHKGQILYTLLQIPDVFYPYHRGIRPNHFGAGPASLLPAIKRFVYRFLERTKRCFLFRHYLYVGSQILFLVYGLWRREKELLVLSLMGLAYLGGFVLVDAHAEWRYLLPTYMCAIAQWFFVMNKQVARTIDTGK